MTTQHAKQIPIDALAVGMYIVGLDQSWLHSPFLWHRRRISQTEDIARLKAYGIRHVTIDPTRGLDVPETLSGPPTASPTLPVPSVMAHTTPPVAPPLTEPRDAFPDLALAQTVHAEATTAVRNFFANARTGAPLQGTVAQEVVEHLTETVLHHAAALAGVVHMRQFDTDLATHAINVCIFALTLGAAQHLDEATLPCLGLAALLHDIGQVHLPRNLLRKPGAYTAAEQRLMQAHPQLGATMLAQMSGISPEACRLVAEHHERLDGSGYPQGLRGSTLSTLSQTVAIADSYETMLGNRTGHPPLLPAQALRELYQCGRLQQLDLRLVETLVRCLGIYPVGSLVALDTGAHAVVVKVHPTDALRPVVRLLETPQPGHDASSACIDLAAVPSRTILHAVDPATTGYDIVQLWPGGSRS